MFITDAGNKSRLCQIVAQAAVTIQFTLRRGNFMGRVCCNNLPLLVKRQPTAESKLLLLFSWEKVISKEKDSPSPSAGVLAA